MPLETIPRNSFIFVLWIIIACSLIIGASSFFGKSKYALSAAPQQQARVIRRLAFARTEPIVITNVKVQGTVVSFDQKFRADDDWMKSLVVSINNISDKRVLFAKVDLFFGPPPGSQVRNSHFYLFFGNHALLWDHSPNSAERLVGLAPGETADVKFTSSQFDGFQRFLADIGLKNVEAFDLRLSSIIFDDDTMWDVQGPFRRDPNHPGSWIPAQKQSGQARNVRSRAVSWGPFPTDAARLNSHAEGNKIRFNFLQTGIPSSEFDLSSRVQKLVYGAS